VFVLVQTEVTLSKLSGFFSSAVHHCRSAARLLTHRHAVTFKCIECRRTHDIRFRKLVEAEDASFRPAMFTGCDCGAFNSLLPVYFADIEIARHPDIAGERQQRLREWYEATQVPLFQVHKFPGKVGNMIHVIDGKSYPS
jgi:hypothetical protein